jgi:hypothetical protein
MVVKKASLVLNGATLHHGVMTTTRLLSLDSLRALAASARRGHLAGSASRLGARDRDLDRIAAGIRAVAQADPERLTPRPARGGRPVAPPVDLAARRGRPAAPVTPTPASHARAS